MLSPAPEPEKLLVLRLVAYTIDSTVSVLLACISFVGIGLGMLVSGGEELSPFGIGIVLGSSLVGFGLAFGFLLFRDALPGGGLGKPIVGIRTVDAKSHRPCRLGQSFLRNIVFVMLGGWDAVAMALMPGAQRLGDKAAGTLVVRRDLVQR